MTIKGPGRGGIMRHEILIVDDQKGVRRLLEEVFKKNKWVVYTAADGMEAMAKLGTISPQVILMDMKMPNMNGLEASQQILQHHPEALIVLMTAYGEMDIVTKAFDTGVRKCVTKPFDIIQLRQEIQEMIDGPNKG